MRRAARRPPTRTRTRSATTRAVVLLGARQHQHELVAAVACDLVVRAHLGAQRVGDAPQQLVAGGVAELVVDPLEVVEVDQHAAERLLLARRARDLLAHAHLHRPVVEQPGQRVGARRGADVVVGLRVVAGDDREVGDRLEHVQVLARDLAPVGEADRECAAQLPVPAHRDADARPHAGDRDVLRLRHACSGSPRSSPAGPRAGPSRRSPRPAAAGSRTTRPGRCARGGERGAVVVDQVHAGDRAADGEVRPRARACRARPAARATRSARGRRVRARSRARPALPAAARTRAARARARPGWPASRR